MKKISVVFALLLMMGFAGGATASSFNWDSLPPGAVVHRDHLSTITASYDLSVAGPFSHDYRFSDGGASHTGFVIGLSNENIQVANLSLDGNAMAWDMANQRWPDFRDVSFLHLLHIEGNVVGISEQHLVRISEMPIPAAIWLFGSALVSLLCISTHKKEG